jgi:cell division topological specificity factor
MNVFRSLQLAASAPVARERLQILLEYERKLGGQIDLFAVLREEILAVVNRHIVDPENVQVTVDRGAKFSTLGVNIEIPNPVGKARTLPTNCPVLREDAQPSRKQRTDDGGRRCGGGNPGDSDLGGRGAVGATLLASTRARSVALITSLFRVSLIVAAVLGVWVYVQRHDVSKRPALVARETALMAGFEEYGNAPRPAEGVVAVPGVSASVALRGTSGPGTLVSLPRNPAAAEPAPQSAAVTPLAALESAMSPPHELTSAAAEPASESAAVTPPAALESATSPHELPSAAAEPASQSAAITPPAALENTMSPPQEAPPLRHLTPAEPAVAPPAALESATSLHGLPSAAVEPASQSAAVTPSATPNQPPTALSQEPPPGSVTPLPKRRPLQIRIAMPPRAVPPPALLRRRAAP